MQMFSHAAAQSPCSREAGGREDFAPGYIWFLLSESSASERVGGSAQRRPLRWDFDPGYRRPDLPCSRPPFHCPFDGAVGEATRPVGYLRPSSSNRGDSSVSPRPRMKSLEKPLSNRRPAASSQGVKAAAPLHSNQNEERESEEERRGERGLSAALLATRSGPLPNRK